MDTHHPLGRGTYQAFCPLGVPATYCLRHLGTLRILWFRDCSKVLGMSLAFSSTSSSNIYLELGQPSPLNHPLKCLRICQVGEWFIAVSTSANYQLFQYSSFHILFHQWVKNIYTYRGLSRCSARHSVDSLPSGHNLPWQPDFP